MLRVSNLSGFGGKRPAAFGGGAMPVVRGVSGARAHGSGAISPGLPAGTATNDILVLLLETSDQAITVAGYTEALNSPSSNSGNTRLTVFWKRAGPGESAPTTSDSGDHQLGYIIGISGCVTSGNPFDVTNSNNGSASGNTVTINGATTTGDNRLVLAAYVTATAAGSLSFANSNLSNVTERVNSTTSIGNTGGLYAASGELATAGDYGSTTALTLTSEPYAGWSGALMA